MGAIKPVGARKVAKKVIKRVSATKEPCIAAVDLGSNSFHLVIAKVHNGTPIVIDKMREMLRFASGLDSNGHIRPEAAQLALTCLRRFGQRLAVWHPQLIRAVGTNTLRQAQNATYFLHKAELKLGVPIEVISGLEEARLIYRGVSKSIQPNEHALVIDIGGGSTELIAGIGPHPHVLESLTTGCVTLTDTLLRGHLLTTARFDLAVRAAHQKLMPITENLRNVGWDRVIGSSGTIRAVESVVRELGLQSGGLTLTVLQNLAERMIHQRRIDRLVFPGLATERAAVFAGGLAILIAVFEALDIREMSVSRSALREGVLEDLMDNLSGHDVRAVALENFHERWPISDQGRRAALWATRLYEAAAAGWKLVKEDGQRITWAAQLHDCGKIIGKIDYAKHSAYLVRYGELAGFSKKEQQLLAVLIEMQQGRWTASLLAPLTKVLGEKTARLAILLRLAIICARLEGQNMSVPIKIRCVKNRLDIKVGTQSQVARGVLMDTLIPELKDMQKAAVRFTFIT